MLVKHQDLVTDMVCILVRDCQGGIRTILRQHFSLGYRLVLRLVYGLTFWLEYGLGYGLGLVAI